MTAFQRSLLLAVLASFLSPAMLVSQDLGFMNSVFTRVHRVSLFVLALDPKDAPILDRTGKGCITMSLCGAGVKVMIDLDTRSDNMELELGLGASYLRALQGSSTDSLDIRGALRSLPVISTQATWLASRWVHPYFHASFGLVDIWNGRAHNSEGRQAELKASTFEYGVSLGVAVRPSSTNGRMLLEGGYRARTFASIGYGFDEPLGNGWPRQLDLSGWQVSAGWQFDLRPIAKSPDFSGAYVLTRVDGHPIPVTLEQERGGDGNVRQELMHAWLDMSRSPRMYRLVLIMRNTTLNTSGVAQQIRYAEPAEERGTWVPGKAGQVLLTREPAAGSSTATATGERLEDELVIPHPATGRRLHFKRVRSS